MKIRLVDAKIALKIKSEDDLKASSQNFSFFLFKSDALVKNSSGITEAKYGDCILYAPDDIISISPVKNEIIVDQLVFKGSDSFRLFSGLEFDTGTVLSPVQTYFIDSSFEKIIKEQKAQDIHFEKIVSILMQELFTKISRFVKQDFVLSLPDHAQKLRELRTDVHENFSNRWTIGNMAEIMGLSSSRFASLYKQIFNISPTEDLIRTRIDQSKKMLSSTKVSIKRVSSACGFESVHYFHRAFKKRIGMTPKHFQNRMLTNQGSVPANESPHSLDALSLVSDLSGTLEIVEGEIVIHGSDIEWSLFLGYSPEDLKNKPFINFVSPEDLSIANEAVSSIVKGKNVFNVHVSLVSKSGDSLPIDFSAVTKGNSSFWFVKKVVLETA